MTTIGKSSDQCKDLSKAVVRTAQANDVEAATDVYLVSLEDLKRRHGAPITPMDRDDWLRGYAHVLATGIFNVIELDGKVVGLANGVLRDDLWFLSGFWMLPGYQGQGLGRQVLDKTFAEAAERGAKRYFVWASIDLPAVANYMRLSMLPGYQIFTVRVPLDSAARPRTEAALLEQYLLSPLEPQAAAEIDSDIRGVGRIEDHIYWSQDPGRQGWLVRRHGQTVGYLYQRQGQVGALAYLDKGDEGAMLDLALAQSAKCEAAQASGAVTVMAPGINTSALSSLLSRGARFTSHSHFLTSAPFGRLENYLPSGPHLY